MDGKDVPSNVNSYLCPHPHSLCVYVVCHVAEHEWIRYKVNPRVEQVSIFDLMGFSSRRVSPAAACSSSVAQS